jgi:iron complex outermembrane receptor protein
MSTSTRLLGLLATASIFGLSAGAAYAQQQAQAQGLALEEITVTARKVEENLMTVPLAITAFSEKDIENRGFKQLNDIANSTPSFRFENQQGGSGRNDRSTNALVFRGLFLGNNVGLSAGGQMFIDGAPIIGAQPPTITDVARIEVLKGPQSAYFGRSTFVGAINFIMKEPANEFKGRIMAEYSRFGGNEQVLSLEGPIVEDKLAVRVSGRHWHEGGAYKNFADPNQTLGDRTTNSVSGAIVFTPTDNLKVKSYINYFENKDGAPAQAALKQDQFNGVANVNGSCGPLTNLPTAASPTYRAASGYYCGTLPSVSELPARIISGDYTITPLLRNTLFNPNPNWIIFDPTFIEGNAHRRQAFQADLRIDYDWESGYSLAALTAYHRDKSSNLIDLNYRDGHDRANPLYVSATATPTRVPWWNSLLISQNRLRDFSQEIRFTSPQQERFRWTLGGNYLTAYSPGGPVYGNLIAGPFFTSAITQQRAKTPAVFGALYFDITEDLTVSGEGRYQWDKISQKPIIGTTGNPVTGVAAQELKETFTSFSPRISIDYKYAQDSTAYALFSRGFRPGGFNAGLVTSTPETLAALRVAVPNAGLSYEEEKVDNYEVGLKSTWLDGRARTTIAAYYMEWLNGQVQQSIPVSVGGTANLIPLTINTGLAKLKGVEFEGQIQATEQLVLSGTFGLNDSKVKSLGLNNTPNCADCSFIFGTPAGAIDNQLPTVPKYTWTLSGEYTDELTSDFDWYGRADYQHTGKKFTDFTNIANTSAIDNLNLRFGIRNDSFTLETFVTNVFDNDQLSHGLLGIDVFTFLFPPVPAGSPPGSSLNKNEIRVSLPRPRVFGVRASYDF